MCWLLNGQLWWLTQWGLRADAVTALRLTQQRTGLLCRGECSVEGNCVGIQGEWNISGNFIAALLLDFTSTLISSEWHYQDYSHSHCASEHPRCKCSYLCFNVWPYCICYNLISLLSRAFSTSCILARMQLFAQFTLRQGLTHTLSRQPMGSGNFKSSHTGGDRNSCGNTSLSPWWRNLCLSTVFYSVCSDDRWCN